MTCGQYFTIHMNPCNLFLNPKSHLFHLSRGDGTTHSPGNCEISGGKLIQDNGMVRNISSQVRLTGLKLFPLITGAFESYSN